MHVRRHVVEVHGRGPDRKAPKVEMCVKRDAAEGWSAWKECVHKKRKGSLDREDNGHPLTGATAKTSQAPAIAPTRPSRAKLPRLRTSA